MAVESITITGSDRAWQDAFIDFIPRVFPSIDFRRWRDLGGWDDRYVAFSWVEGDRIVANASRMRMDLVIAGRRVRGWQLTAVGTLPAFRRRGLQQQLLHRLLEATPPSEMVFLFGNQDVIDFYPRFGFTRLREFVFQAEHAVVRAGTPLRALDLAEPDDIALLSRIAADATPVTTGFAARDYGSIVLWYWTNFFQGALRHLPEQDAILIATEGEDVLQIHDVLAPEPFDLRAVLPRIASRSAARVEFGFTPDRYWPSATPRYEFSEGPLFVRNAPGLPDTPFKFPALATT